MSQENVKLFLEELTKNESLRREIGPISTKGELIAAAARAGFPFTEKQLEAYKSGEGTTESVELTDEELGKVAAGIRIVSGYMQTFAWYGCTQWTPDTWNAWNAVKGECGSCGNWHVDIGDSRCFGICLINKE